jgi:methionyl-tRNA synthetase
MKRNLITSALPYANGYIHFGHLAGAYIPADLYARFLRLKGNAVMYVCGSDEHGVAINIAADKESTTPSGIIDKYHYANLDAFQKIGMSFDIYSRTSNKIHHETAREFFQDFLKKGYLVEKEEEQFYDASANMFLPDRYVEGICPNCSYDKARGDQCDNCGAYYNQIELKEPKSLISGKTPSIKATTHWYLKFQDFQEFLEKYINSKEHFWKDNVLQQTRSWLKAGLSERAITRDLDWGIKITDLEGIDNKKAAGKALYVWFDAVLGYITASKELCIEDPKFGSWKDWWQNQETSYNAFIGKDNIVFHTLIFPAMLHGRTDENNPYILPENVPANEFLNLEGQKISKSRNWTIDVRDFVAENPDTIYMDTLRYALAANSPESKDADFTWRDYQAKANNELASIFGNFVNRSLQFMYKNFPDGKIPDFTGSLAFSEEWKELSKAVEDEIDTDNLHFSLLNENDKNLIIALSNGTLLVSELYSKFRFREALLETMNIARAANKYFNDEEPWKKIKTSPNDAAKTIFVCVNLVNSLSILFAPIIPFSCAKIQKWLGRENPMVGDSLAKSNSESIKSENIWDQAMFPLLETSTFVQPPSILFARIEDKFVEDQIAKLGNNNKQEQIDEEDLISIDDFKKIKLRTAIVLEAEKVAKSDKLLKLKVDVDGKERQILAGIAKYYTAEEMIGKTVVIVANLKAAKLMGMESQGMVLAASDAEGNLSLVSPIKEMKSGSEVR